MKFADITTCDIANGDGIGVVLWCQGCSLKCEGCHNKCTQDADCGTEFTDYYKNNILSELRRKDIDRLTLSGGHPLEKYNVDGCLDLCKAVRKEFGDSIRIWLYTGYVFESIADMEILKYVDVLVDGPFELDKRDIRLAYRGSSNQRVIDVKKSLSTGSVVLYCN